ncbi:uncharacterized protein LOC100383802 [Zea mays]|uniref:uncharacterized protein LOC100383802 n=1 Tax=Zea mays TaxID=4577 RepID=UPI00022158D4|nr:uncharacterized protein LOC100383802 [Zea mays]|eukprot:NP_001169907.2 uncharacterized protein LOC100383802 [Zea mays]
MSISLPAQTWPPLRAPSPMAAVPCSQLPHLPHGRAPSPATGARQAHLPWRPAQFPAPSSITAHLWSLQLISLAVELSACAPGSCTLASLIFPGSGHSWPPLLHLESRSPSSVGCALPAAARACRPAYSSSPRPPAPSSPSHGVTTAVTSPTEEPSNAGPRRGSRLRRPSTRLREFV